MNVNLSNIPSVEMSENVPTEVKTLLVELFEQATKEDLVRLVKNMVNDNDIDWDNLVHYVL